MAQGRKYAALPDLDSAPDVYETQEPADDDDARSATSHRSSSAASSYQDLDDAAAAGDPAASGVDRAQLQPGDARSHFKPSRVDARRVDFSDRVGGGRRSYKVASRRRRTEFLGVASTDDETYDEKLARLKREVEELQSLGNKEGSDATPNGKDVVNDLSNVLHSLESPALAPSTTQDHHDEHSAPATGTTAEDLANISVPDMAQTERALQLAATLEGRLTALESALGLPALSLPQNTTNIPTTSQAADQPIFATLATLDRNLTTLTTTTGPTLSSLASQIHSLTASAESLTAARKAATAARKDLRATAPTTANTSVPATSRPISSQSFSTSRPSSYARPRPTDDAAADDAPAAADAAALLAAEDSEQARRVARLHAALPTVEHLAPLVPAVLERLASLRALHEGAAGAAGALDALEKGQARMAGDVREWRAAVAELEGRIVEGQAGDVRNREVVKGWVGELQGRLDKVVAG